MLERYRQPVALLIFLGLVLQLLPTGSAIFLQPGADLDLADTFLLGVGTALFLYSTTETGQTQLT